MNTHIESVERYLLRIVPNLASEWEGASEEEIASIRALTPHPLPAFYEWFLRRLGRHMGRMANPVLAYSVQAMQLAYADEEDDPIPERTKQRFLMIAYNLDEMMPQHLWYDLTRPTEGDALVVHGRAATPGMTPVSATFAELFVWGEANRFRVEPRAQRCDGSFTDDAYEPFVCLDPVMEELGFHQPVAMGDRCRVYERDDATMACKGSVDEERDKYRFYHLGARDEATIRSILGTIARKTRLQVDIDKWRPPLQEP
jgi:hypothetical protein